MPAGIRDRRVPFESPVRYRRIGEPEWHFGNTIDASGTGLLFFCENPLEVGAEIEAVLPAMAQQAGSAVLLTLNYRGRVVRKVSPRAHDDRPGVAIKVSQCQITTAPDEKHSNTGKAATAEKPADS